MKTFVVGDVHGRHAQLRRLLDMIPRDMLSDLWVGDETDVGPTRAGILPYLALAGGAFFCFLGWYIFWSGTFI